MKRVSKFESEPTLPMPEESKYELSVGPDLSAIVEIDQIPEVYFDRRKETLDAPQEQKTPQPKPMIPLRSLLAHYDEKLNTRRSAPKAPKNTQPVTKMPILGHSIAPLAYKKYVRLGMASGLLIAVIKIISLYT